jgi:hypothetical protein
MIGGVERRISERVTARPGDVVAPFRSKGMRFHRLSHPGVLKPSGPRKIPPRKVLYLGGQIFERMAGAGCEVEI